MNHSDLHTSRTSSDIQTLELEVSSINYENFQPYGTLITAAEDGKPFGADEAQLDLSQGQPRFYIMQLPNRGLSFHQITRHLRVTQCLAAVDQDPWLLAVAPPAALDNPEAVPTLESIRAFQIPGDQAIQLHRGTWHAGPYFTAPTMAFFNLELIDTNQVDHHSCNLDHIYGIALCFRM
jgi:ureidoglycolate hydrolase